MDEIISYLSFNTFIVFPNILSTSSLIKTTRNDATVKDLCGTNDQWEHHAVAADSRSVRLQIKRNPFFIDTSQITQVLRYPSVENPFTSLPMASIKLFTQLKTPLLERDRKKDDPFTKVSYGEVVLALPF